MNNGPSLWAEILAQVRPVYGDTAVIAGGCVRDYLLGREPKDIDVFVNASTARLAVRSFDLPRRFMVSALAKASEYEDESNDFGAEVAGVLDGTYTDTEGREHAIQIIARPHPDFSGPQLVAQLDLDICRSWYDGATLHETPEARQARYDGTIRAIRPNNRTADRISRLSERLGLKVSA